MSMNTLDHPYRFDGQCRSAATGLEDHVRDLIEQVLFTAPGERVMRPDFGAGLLAMVFEPNSTTAAETVQFLATAGLQRHLAHLIVVDAVQVENIDSALQVTVRYSLVDDGSAHQAAFTVPGGAS